MIEGEREKRGRGRRRRRRRGRRRRRKRKRRRRRVCWWGESSSRIQDDGKLTAVGPVLPDTSAYDERFFLIKIIQRKVLLQVNF